jgi:hypothetical protein
MGACGIIWIESYEYSLIFFKVFFDLEEIIFENFNNSENNMISAKLVKILG